jgi:hypothetical protein
VNRSPIDTVIARLEAGGCNPRKSGAGQWRSLCPVHKGRSSNLSIGEGDDGTVVLHCHHQDQGRETCSAAAIAGALGLELRDLFPTGPGSTAGKPGPGPRPKARGEARDKAGTIYQSAERAAAACVRTVLGGRASVQGPWIYKDTEGFEVMRTVRIEQPGGKKQFRPVYPDAAGWRVGDPFDSGLPLYHLDEIPSADVVYVTEGEKCADLVRGLGLVATTSSHGAGAAKKTDWSPLAGKDVRIIPDRDKAGEGYLDAVGAILGGLEPRPVVRPIRLPVAGEGDDVEQWLEGLPDGWAPDRCRAELERIAEAAPEWSEAEACPLVVRADRVESRDVQWLWPGRVPYSFITIFAGRTGVGKSFVALDIAARKTRGDDWPDGQGECCRPGNVLIISEDPHDFVLRPRLEAMGADLSRVFFMTWDAMATYRLEDTETLDKIVRQAGDPDLIVIDPPTNFLGDVDEHRNSEVRGVLMKLVAWLVRQSRPIALILITQVTKGGKEVEAINRIIGSVAWGATSRIAHTFAPDREAPGGGFFSCPKSNLGPIPRTLGYRIVPAGRLARVEWGDESEASADEVMGGERKPENRRARAETFLIECFNRRPQWASEELLAEGVRRGINRDAMFEARKSLGLGKARKIGAIWYWSIPDDWPHLEAREDAPL